MVLDHSDDSVTADVLLRLLVNLTNPVMILYREELPKDNVGRRIFLELVEILQLYKEAFSAEDVWALLGSRLQKALAVVSILLLLSLSLILFFYFCLFFFRAWVNEKRNTNF